MQRSGSVTSVASSVRDKFDVYTGFHERSAAGIGGSRTCVITNAYKVQARKSPLLLLNRFYVRASILWAENFLLSASPSVLNFFLELCCFGWFFVWLIDWLVGWLIDCYDWSIGWLMVVPTFWTAIPFFSYGGGGGGGWGFNEVHRVFYCFLNENRLHFFRKIDVLIGQWFLFFCV